jgi:hypothetical protein
MPTIVILKDKLTRFCTLEMPDSGTQGTSGSRTWEYKALELIYPISVAIPLYAQQGKPGISSRLFTKFEYEGQELYGHIVPGHLQARDDISSSSSSGSGSGSVLSSVSGSGGWKLVEENMTPQLSSILQFYIQNGYESFLGLGDFIDKYRSEVIAGAATVGVGALAAVGIVNRKAIGQRFVKTKPKAGVTQPKSGKAKSSTEESGIAPASGAEGKPKSEVNISALLTQMKTDIAGDLTFFDKTKKTFDEMRARTQSPQDRSVDDNRVGIKLLLTNPESLGPLRDKLLELEKTFLEYPARKSELNAQSVSELYTSYLEKKKQCEVYIEENISQLSGQIPEELNDLLQTIYKLQTQLLNALCLEKTSDDIKEISRDLSTQTPMEFFKDVKLHLQNDLKITSSQADTDFLALIDLILELPEDRLKILDIMDLQYLWSSSQMAKHYAFKHRNYVGNEKMTATQMTWRNDLRIKMEYILRWMLKHKVDPDNMVDQYLQRPILDFMSVEASKNTPKEEFERLMYIQTHGHPFLYEHDDVWTNLCNTKAGKELEEKLRRSKLNIWNEKGDVAQERATLQTLLTQQNEMIETAKQQEKGQEKDVDQGGNNSDREEEDDGEEDEEEEEEGDNSDPESEDGHVEEKDETMDINTLVAKLTTDLDEQISQLISLEKYGDKSNVWSSDDTAKAQKQYPHNVAPLKNLKSTISNFKPAGQSSQNINEIFTWYDKYINARNDLGEYYQNKVVRNYITLRKIQSRIDEALRNLTQIFDSLSLKEPPTKT